MQIISELLFLRRLRKLVVSAPRILWNSQLLKHGFDIVHFVDRSTRAELVTCVESGSELIDVGRFNGLTSSITDIEDDALFSFEQLTRDKKRVPFETDTDYSSNTAWLNARFSQWICYYQAWDGRLFIDTQDGSHHFSATYCQALTQNRKFELNCRVYVERINSELLGRIRAGQTWLFLDKETIYRIIDLKRADHFFRENDPIIYPVEGSVLKIRKTRLGLLMIDVLRTFPDTIELLDEVWKFA